MVSSIYINFYRPSNKIRTTDMGVKKYLVGQKNNIDPLVTKNMKKLGGFTNVCLNSIRMLFIPLGT